MFDQKTIVAIGNYVYALLDPDTNQPFYIGKGKGNRVFDHADGAINSEDDSSKYTKIRAILAAGKEVKHVIIRHGLGLELDAHRLEAALIDLLNYLGMDLTNVASGHHSSIQGVMTTDEVLRLYNAAPLKSMEDTVIMININKSYARAQGADALYQATRSAWAIDSRRKNSIRHALAEYRGLIAEVYEIHEWIPVPTLKKDGTTKNRWAFNGRVADAVVRDKYINRSVAHVKVRGNANPIRYSI